jgi:hypothetical protein
MMRKNAEGLYPGFNGDTWYGMDSAPEDTPVDLWGIPIMQHTAVELGSVAPDCIWNAISSKKLRKVGWYYRDAFNGPTPDRFAEKLDDDGTAAFKAIAWRFRPEPPTIPLEIEGVLNMMRRAKVDGVVGYPGFNPHTWYSIFTGPEDERVDLWCVPTKGAAIVGPGKCIADCLYNKEPWDRKPRIGWYYCDTFAGPGPDRFVETPQPDGTIWKAVAWRFRPAPPQIRLT